MWTKAYDYVFTGRRKLGNGAAGRDGLGEASWKFDAKVIDGTVNDVGWMTRCSASTFDLVGQVDHRRCAGEWSCDSGANDFVIPRDYSNGDWCSGTRWSW